LVQQTNEDNLFNIDNSNVVDGKIVLKEVGQFAPSSKKKKNEPKAKAKAKAKGKTKAKKAEVKADKAKPEVAQQQPKVEEVKEQEYIDVPAEASEAGEPLNVDELMAAALGRPYTKAQLEAAILEDRERSKFLGKKPFVCADDREGKVCEQLGIDFVIAAVGKDGKKPNLPYNRLGALFEHLNGDMVREGLTFHTEVIGQFTYHHLPDRRIFTTLPTIPPMECAGPKVAPRQCWFGQQTVAKEMAANDYAVLGCLNEHTPAALAALCKYASAGVVGCGYMIVPKYTQGTFSFGARGYDYAANGVSLIISDGGEAKTLYHYRFDGTYAIACEDNRVLSITVQRVAELGEAYVAWCTLRVGLPGSVMPPRVITDSKLLANLASARSADDFAKLVNAVSALEPNPRITATEEASFKEEGDFFYVHRKKKETKLAGFEHLKLPYVRPKNVHKVTRKTINKVNLIFTAANRVDRAGLVSALEYVNREHPDLDLIKETLPLVAYCIRESLISEAFVKQMCSSKNVELLNAFKRDAFKVTPTSLISAWKEGRTLEYIEIYIKGLLRMNDQIVMPGATRNLSDFQ
jgi:hypothetical protein